MKYHAYMIHAESAQDRFSVKYYDKTCNNVTDCVHIRDHSLQGNTHSDLLCFGLYK